MKANAVPLLDLFAKKMRLEVPLFQRQYVWEQETQWEPLWEDISGKFAEYLEGRKDAPIHFLGAMVLDQKMTPATHVEKRQVIDGQQRLTTLQIILAALRDFCRSQQCEPLAKELDRYTLNDGILTEPEVDKFKVWPTQGDREQFADVVGIGSREEIEKRHPLVREKYARAPKRRPRMVEAYLYFSDRYREFFLGTEAILRDSVSLPERLDECFQALRNAFQVVAIDLERDDDAQVIFETLNARGQVLLPSDLLRNYIFLRAGRNKEPQEELYEKHWKQFEDAFWGEEVRQGRLSRPRSDVFMQHFLASRTTVDIPAKHLFVEYRHWIEREKPFATVRNEVTTLSLQGREFRRLLEPTPKDPIYPLAKFLIDFEMSTVYPLLLHLFDASFSEQDWRTVATTLESYFVRRTILGWTTKNYNKTFLNLTKALRQVETTPKAVETFLSRLHGETAGWPTDEEFAKSWYTLRAYKDLNNTRLVHILRKLNETYLTKFNEKLQFDGSLSIEHIMPTSWLEHWPLRDGTRGMTDSEIQTVDAKDPRVTATRTRNLLLDTFGNLTIITQALNSSASNQCWEAKRKSLLQGSLLPINQELHDQQVWNEETIIERSQALLKRALTLWPRPIRAESA